MPAKYAILLAATLALVSTPALSGYEEGVLAYDSGN